MRNPPHQNQTPQPGHLIHRHAPISLLSALALTLTSCVHVYQPMTGLQQPVVVDPRSKNFKDLNLTLRCVPGDYLNFQQSDALCDKVSTLFINQGAKVTVTNKAFIWDDDRDTDKADSQEEEEARADLVMVLRSRKLSESNDPLLWSANVATCTVIPAVSEQIFAQEIEIRDSSGFLLATESVQGRMIRYFGIGAWSGNALVNVFSREEEDKIRQDTASKDLSEDMYKQLSQLVYNAKVQQELLRPATPAAPR